MKKSMFVGLALFLFGGNVLFGQEGINPPPSQAPVQEAKGISLGVRGGVFSSLQMWDQVNDSSASKMGFGGMATIALGISIDKDMFLGVGPHFGGNFWPVSVTTGGYTATATTNVLDYGANVYAEFDDMYMIFGLGSANLSVTASYAGDSETIESPLAAKYQRVGIGWGRSLAFGISYVSYSDWAHNLSHLEINLGYSF